MKYSEYPRGYQGATNGPIDGKKHKYKYPRDLNFAPGSELHNAILNKILDLCEYSSRVIDGSKDEWKKIDWSLNAYVPASEADVYARNKDSRVATGIVVPMTFASLETFLTYFWSAFIQDPIHRYKGYGENRVGAMLMERLISKQGQWFKEPLKLDTMWRDSLTYGFGAAHLGWSKKRVKRRISSEVDELLYEALKDTPFKSQIGDIVRYMEDGVAYEGNELTSIDPYRMFLDPRVSPNDYQKSGFIGWVDDGDLYELMEREQDPEEGIFNMKYVAEFADRGLSFSRFHSDETGRNTRQQTENILLESGEKYSSPPVHLVHMYMKVIPAQCGLGPSEYPEVWEFTIAGDTIIIQADQLDLDHGMYPIVMCAPNTDGHSVMPVSYLATTYGMQKYIDQQFRFQEEEQRTCINNKLVLDPNVFEMADVLDTKNGGIIRARRSSYNRPLAESIFQLPVTPVTQQNINNAGVMIDLMRQANGTTDITMGNLSNMPERPTATGIDAAKSGALSRLQRIAQIVGRQAMDDIAWMMAYNTIQFMSQDAYAEIGGRYEQQLRKAYGVPSGMPGEITVTPFDLQPYFDIEPRDGTLPNSENAQAWTTIMQTMLGIEGVGQQLMAQSDVMKIFTHWARIMGARDIDEFIGGGGQMPQVTPMPDEQVMQQVEAGNLVPMQNMQGMAV